jgi:hypothetical protein
MDKCLGIVIYSDGSKAEIWKVNNKVKFKRRKKT